MIEKLKALWKMAVADGLPWLALLVLAVMAAQWAAGYDLMPYVNTLANLMWAGLMLYVTIKVLRYMHKGLVGSFRTDVFDKMAGNPVALAIYFGCQLIAVALIVSRAFA